MCRDLFCGEIFAFGGATGWGAKPSSERSDPRGAGVESCDAYAQARTRHDDLLYGAWIGGYLTASNLHSPDTYDLASSTDMPGILEWLDDWCRSNPTGRFADAVKALIIFLYPRRARAEH
jgi:hypothetical protein